MVMAAQEKKLTSNLVQILKNASLFLGGLNSYQNVFGQERQRLSIEGQNSSGGRGQPG